ncbi:MAG: hypothetical protein ACE365_00515 [Gammaproteobacteria bacterium]
MNEEKQLDQPSSLEVDSQEEKKDSDSSLTHCDEIKQFLSLGIVLAGMAIEFIGVNAILSTFKYGDAAAAAVTAPYNLISNPCSSFFTIATLSLEHAKSNKETGEIVQDIWLWTEFLGLASTTGLIIAGGFFYTTLDYEIAQNAAFPFMLGAALSQAPSYMIVRHSTDIEYLANKTQFPILNSILFRLISPCMGYVLGVQLGLGPFGLGFASAVTAQLFTFVSRAYFNFSEFSKYEIPKFEVSYTYFQKFINSRINFLINITKNDHIKNEWLPNGWRYALQGLLSWGNLTLMTTAVGLYNTNDLTALLPSLLYFTLVGLFSQGIGLAAVELAIKKIRHGMEKQAALNALTKKMVAIAIVGSIILGSVVYATEPYITQTLISDSALHDDAKRFLIAHLIFTPFEWCRYAFGVQLSVIGKEQLTQGALFGFFCMTILTLLPALIYGIPEENTDVIVWMRNIGIALNTIVYGAGLYNGGLPDIASSTRKALTFGFWNNSQPDNQSTRSINQEEKQNEIQAQP